MSRNFLTVSLCTLMSSSLFFVGCGGDDDDDADDQADDGAAVDAGSDDDDGGDEPDAGDDGGDVDAGSDTVTQTEEFRTLAGAVELEGSSGTLVRTAESWEIDITVTDLIPGNVYTMWWVIYQNPELCVQGEGNPDALSLCGAPADLPVNGSDPDHVTDVQSALIYALPRPDGGATADEAGTITLSRTYLANTDPEEGIYYPAGSAPPVGYWEGLTNPLTAEVHVAIRDHGPVGSNGIDLDEQRSDFLTSNCGPKAPLYPCVTYAAAVFKPE